MEDQISDGEKITSTRKSSSKLFMIVAIFMLSAVLLCLVLTIIITVVLAVTVDDKSCGSNKCQAELLRALNFTDDTVEPCDDFYRFSCGRYNDPSNPIFLQSVEKKLQKDLDEIIMQEITSDDPASLAMAKSFYQSCVHTESDQLERDRSFYRLLHSLGGWPIVNGSNWNEEDFDWWKAASVCAENGLDFDWFVDIDVKENEEDNVYNLYVGYPSRYMENLEDDAITKYRKLMEDIAIYMGAPIESVYFEVERTVQFQKDLYAITKDAADSEKLRIGKLFNYRVIDLQNQMQGVPWMEFLRNTTGRVYKPSDIVSVNSMRYIANLYQLLLRTPKRFQADYIIMKLIDKFWPHLSNIVASLYENYQQDTQMNYSPFNRTRACLQKTHESFKGVADAVYIRSTIDPQVKREVKELVSVIKYKLANHLKSATWVDEENKNFAMVNITELFEYIGGPDEVFDVERYEKKLGYTGFEEADMNIIDKIAHMNRQAFRKRFEKIGSPIDDTNRDPELVHEHLKQVQNDFVSQVLPACFLRYEFYDPTRPKYVNFGTLATLISYKTMSTFTERLYKYSKHNGKTQWWSNSLDINSIKKCFPVDDMVEFYEILTNNGNFKIEIYFPDYIGVDLTFEAYQQWVKQHGSEAVPSKYKYNANQFLWIYSIQLLCTTESDENMELYNDARDKANKLVENSFYFANVFKCPPNSNMNPDEKCRVV